MIEIKFSRWHRHQQTKQLKEFQREIDHEKTKKHQDEVSRKAEWQRKLKEIKHETDAS